MAFIINWAQDKAAGLLATGLQAGGTLAGNAVGGVGTMIENGGRALGEGVNGSVRGVGSSINKYGSNIIGSMAADGPVNRGDRTQKKTAVKPDTSMSNGTQTRTSNTRTPSIRPQATLSARSTLGSNLNPNSTTPKIKSGGKTRIGPESRPQSMLNKPSASIPARAQSMPSVPGTTAGRKPKSGKTRISPESRRR